MRKCIGIFRLVLICLLVARKENSTGFSTGLTGRSKNLDPTGRSTRPVPVDPTSSISALILEKWTNVLENCLASLKSLNIHSQTNLVGFINWAIILKIKTTKHAINKVALFGKFIFSATCIRNVCNNRLLIMSL